MKKYCFAAIFLAIFLVVNETGYIMCQEQNELPFEDSDSNCYVDGSDCIRRYMILDAHGDYTKLKLIVRSRKQDYRLEERVWIKFFVRNDSDSEVHIFSLGSTRFCAHFWKLFHSNYDEAIKTPKWEEEFQKYKQGTYGIYGFSWGGESGYYYMKLQPGHEHEMDGVCLNDYFDLSKPDIYELTCFATSFIRGQYYDPPLQSNTLTFRVLEGSRTWQEEKESGKAEYTNPLPGEEVFKQPKPPKNVFYVQSSTGPPVIIDVSPYTYYRQQAKDAEAENVDAPTTSDAPESQSE